MEFESWWETYWKPSSQPPIFDAAMKEIALAAYRAGLLHAAEQDREYISGLLNERDAAQFACSASLHEQAAEKLK